MIRRAALFLTAAFFASAASAQPMDHSGHEGHGETDHSQPDQPGDAPPPVPTDHPADRYNDPARMKAARMALKHMGHYTTGAVFVDELEYRAVDGSDGYGWRGQAWHGDDIDKVAITTEGEGRFGKAPERAEASLLWRHAVNPWFNLELGVRQDFRPAPQRTYAVAGIQGLAPYWFELEGQAFVSNKGDVHARLTASHDLRVTQRLILEPEAELNLALQDVPELGVGSGLDRIELGARLRYEFVPEFAPYLGLHWERKLGGSADYARAQGEDASGVSAVAGVRAWF